MMLRGLGQRKGPNSMEGLLKKRKRLHKEFFEAPKAPRKFRKLLFFYKNSMFKNKI